MEEDSQSSQKSDINNGCLKTVEINSTHHIMEEDSQSSQKADLTYMKTSGFADIAGQLFEIKVSGLMFTRCLLAYPRVNVASNVKGAGLFDDIVIKIGDTPVFMQLKHVKKKSISISHLTQLEGNFSLIQFYKSYCKFKKIWNKDKTLQELFRLEDAVFVLYTNAKHSHRITDHLDKGWQDILDTGGTYFRFTKETHAAILEMFENLPVLRDTLNSTLVELSSSMKTVVKMLTAKSVPDIECLSKIIEELNNLDDLESYKEFLSRFWFFTNQASESALTILIQNELEKLLGASGDHLISCYAAFFEEMQKWWRSSKGYIITKDSKFWKEITQSCIDKLTDSRVKELKTKSLKFSENELKSFRERVFADVSIVKVVASNAIILTAMKVHQCLGKENHLLVDVSSLSKHKEEVLGLWRRCCNMLVLTLLEEKDVWRVEPLLDILNTIPGKLLILVGSIPRQKISKLPSTPYTIVDHFHVIQLNYSSYAQVRELCVNLQGYNVSVEEVINIEHLSGDVLVQLLLHKKTKIGSHLGQTIKYFIPRTVKRMDVVDNKIFCNNTQQSVSNDYFIVGNTTELQRLVPEGSKVCIFGQDNFNREYHFIQVDEHFTVNNFEALCSAANNNMNFHWFNVNTNDTLIWQKSKGSLKFITEYLKGDTLYNTVHSIKDRLVIIVAEPGMGKTVLLSNIALHFKSLKPSSWVINVILNNHTAYLNQADSTAYGLLELSADIHNALERELFYHAENVLVLMDGFDEICPGYCDKVLGFVKDLLSEKNIKQIWLSSRPIMKYKLQTTFASLAFDLVPLSREDQKLFLEKYWEVCNVDSFIEKLLDLIRECMNDALGKFTGIPLQLQMLGEVCREDIAHYMKTGNIKLPSILDLLQLYRMFVDTKWEIYLRYKTRADMTNETQKRIYSKLKCMFIEQHEICALFTFLTPEEFSDLPNADGMKKEVSNLVEELQTGHEKTGIISSFVNGQPVFIHRTFQEYFIALWLSQNFRKMSEFLKNKIIDEKFRVVMKFFDRMLAQNCCLHVAIMNADFMHVKNLLEKDPGLIRITDKGGRTALHVSVLACNNRFGDTPQETHYKILDMILNVDIDLSKCDKVLQLRSLQYADMLQEWKVIGLFLRKSADTTDLILTECFLSQSASEDEHDVLFQEYDDFHPLTEPLTLIMTEGFAEMLEFFLTSGIDIEKKLIPKYIYKVNYCWETMVTLLQASCFEGHIDMVELLLRKGAIVDAHDANYRMTALMWAALGGHAEILELLLQYGANCNAQGNFYYHTMLFPTTPLQLQLTKMQYTYPVYALNRTTSYEKGHTALHLAVIWCRKEAVQVLLKHRVHVDIGDAFEHTPLHLAAECGYLEIVEQLVEGGASIDKGNRWKLTPLHISLIYSHFSCNNTVTEYLICHGADKHVVDMDGHTPLHYAVMNNNLSVTQYLLESGTKMDIANVDGYTPMDIAVKYGNLNAVMCLVNHGASVTQSNEKGLTPLHVAIKNGQEVLTKWLILHGACVDHEDRCGNTALHLAALSTHEVLAIAKHLIDKRAKIDKANRCGKTPLHYAVNIKKLDMLTFLIKCGASVNHHDNKGISPLHIAAAQDHLELVEFLIREGAVVNATSNDGKTPLHHSISSGKINIVNCLINNGACINQGDASNKSALYLASEYGLLNIAALLVQHGAVVNSVTTEGQMPLHIAAEMGHLNIIELLVTSGSCISKGDKCGFTALHLAVEHFEVIEYLAKHGADINQRDANGCMALHYAARHGSLDVVQWLVKRNVSVYIRSNDGKTPLQFALEGMNSEVISWIYKQSIDLELTQKDVNELLCYAACRNDPELVQKMAYQGGNVNKKFCGGLTVFHIAAMRGFLLILEVLSNLGANINQRSYDGSTALHFAAENGRLKVVQWLVQHGSKPVQRSNNGTTPLHLAAKGGHVLVVKWLERQGADLRDRTNDGQTIMHFAAQADDTEMMNWLSLKSVSLLDKTNDGRGVIHFIACKGQIDTVQWLTNVSGIDIHEKTINKATVMHFAVQENFYEFLMFFHWLRNEGFSLLDTCSDGRTCVHFAAFANNLHWLDYAVNNYSINLDAPCADGRTPVHFAAQGGGMNVLPYLQAKGCNLLQKSNDGRTVIHFAALGGSIPLIKWLLQQGADVHENSDDGKTMLHFAAEGGHLEAFQWLIKQHVNMHQKSKEGISVLHSAAKGGCLHLLKWMVKHGFGLNKKSYDGRTLLHFAAEGGSLRVVQWLVKQGLDVYQKASNGLTPFDFAVAEKNSRIANWLYSISG